MQLEAKIDIASSGDNTIIAASAGDAFSVRQLFLVPTADVTITIKSGSTVIVGAIPLIGNTIFKLEITDAPWFTCATGQALVFNLSGAIQVGGRLLYDSLDM